MQLKTAAAKSGAHVYEIVNSLITQEQDTITALHHAVRRNHNYSPASCGDCGFIHELFQRYVNNKIRRRRKQVERDSSDLLSQI